MLVGTVTTVVFAGRARVATETTAPTFKPFVEGTVTVVPAEVVVHAKTGVAPIAPSARATAYRAASTRMT